MVEEASKLQKVECDASDLFVAIECGGSDAVSYTHLDVYKRQAQGASYLYLLRIVGGYNAPPSLILRNYLWLLRFSFTSTLRL